jgi:poly(hydroxyalkanoate) depolymerase family esterase
MKMRSNRETLKFYKSALAVLIILFVMTMSPSAATLTQITDFGTNPSNLQMYVYVPPNVKTHPAIIVALHACHGKAADVLNDWASYATQYGFIVISPGNFSSLDSCWDLHTTATLTHNGGGDASGIVSMVKYAVKTYSADSNRVYCSGYSSGGMMTNVLLGSYPDVFKGGAAFAGVPFGCYAGSVDKFMWSSQCATGQITKTAAEWGDLVRAAYPGYTGPRPKMQLWHGTVDQTVSYVDFGEEIKQWTNVLGVSQTPTTTEADQPQSGMTRTRYANSAGVVQVEAISEAGKNHNSIVKPWNLVVTWLGLDKTTSINNGDGAILNVNGQIAQVKMVKHEMSNSLRFKVSAFSGTMGLEVYNLSGKKIHTVADQFDARQEHEFFWDGRLINGDVCSSGAYILSVKVHGAAVGSYPFTFCAK